MTYEQCIQYINAISSLGAKLGLFRIEKLLEKLGNPHIGLKVIHVAGTNGKGSICAMLSSILQCAGYTVGVYTSPHLESFRERYRINESYITKEDFAEAITEIANACHAEKDWEQEHPTVFEVLTAAAFLYFKNKKVDILILEVGLGGKYDATNVIQMPLLSVIASVSMDHMDYLGNSLAGIAEEKAGIIKAGCPAVLYPQTGIVEKIVRKTAERLGSKLYTASDAEIEIITQSLEETVFSFQTSAFCYPSVKIHMLGVYQAYNAATVLLACAALRKEGISLAQENILEGLNRAQWQGRMEIVRQKPTVIIDGAHNADGIAMLVRSIRNYFSGKKVTLLFGVLSDKEYGQMLTALLPLVNRVVATEPNNPRALPADALAKLCQSLGKEVWTEKNRETACKLAMRLTGEEEILLCAGSLYLIGELRGYFKKMTVRRDSID